jgi:hypothetical protein
LTGGTLTGYGKIHGILDGGSGSSILATGNLSLGDEANADGFSLEGALDLGVHAVTLRNANESALGQTTTLNGGRLVAANGVSVPLGGTLSGRGLIEADIDNSGAITGTAVLQFSGVIRGEGQGISGSVIRFGAGGGYEGAGAISASVDGLADSSIIATGDLTLGRDGAANGFQTAGDLNVGSHRVTLLDSDGSDLGSLTLLDGGVLVADAGVSLGRRDRLEGAGDILGAVYSEGTIDSMGLVFLGATVSPLGSTIRNTGGVVFEENFAGAATILGVTDQVAMFYARHEIGDPGPVSADTTAAVVVQTSVAYDPQTVAAFELGGGGLGDFDRLEVGGEMQLAGRLEVSLVDGFTPAVGDVFEILTSSALSGGWDSIAAPQWAAELPLLVESGLGDAPTSVRLLAAMPGDFDLNGVVGVSDLIRWAENFGSVDVGFERGDSNADGEVGVSDLIVWAERFGSDAGSLGPPAVASPESVSAVSAVAIPEPSGVLALGFLTGGIVRCRRGVGQREHDR